MSTAFIFPAFITNYTEKEIDFLKQNGVDINKYLEIASEVYGEKMPKFDYNSNYYISDELMSQFIAYVFACAINDVIRSKEIAPDYIAGYSMGIYAALYASKAIDFKEGLNIILKAFNLVSEITRSGTYGMAATIGLSSNDINNIILTKQLDVEIININNSHSIVVAGSKTDITTFLNFARQEGAMSASELIVNTPYHSKYLVQYSDRFKDIINQTNIGKAHIPVISTFNQKICINESDIRSDLIYNLTEKINWYNTMRALMKLGANTFYEVGAGKDLTKMARFIDGDYKMESIYKIYQ